MYVSDAHRVSGWAFCLLMKLSHKRGYIDRESYVAQYLALAFLTIGIASTIGVDDLLAAFAAGECIADLRGRRS